MVDVNPSPYKAAGWPAPDTLGADAYETGSEANAILVQVLFALLFVYLFAYSLLAVRHSYSTERIAENLEKIQAAGAEAEAKGHSGVLLDRTKAQLALNLEAIRHEVAGQLRLGLFHVRTSGAAAFDLYGARYDGVFPNDPELQQLFVAARAVLNTPGLSNVWYKRVLKIKAPPLELELWDSADVPNGLPSALVVNADLKAWVLGQLRAAEEKFRAEVREIQAVVKLNALAGLKAQGKVSPADLHEQLRRSLWERGYPPLEGVAPGVAPKANGIRKDSSCIPPASCS